MIKLLRFLAGPVITGLAVGLVALWWYQWGPNAEPAQHDTGVASYSGAVNHAAPAVVNIYTTQIITNEDVAEDPLFNRFMEQPRAANAP